MLGSVLRVFSRINSLFLALTPGDVLLLSSVTDKKIEAHRDEVPYLKLPNLRAVVFFNDSDDEGWCLNIAGVIC